LIAALAFVPHPVKSDLGVGWNCSQTLVVTSCAPVATPQGR
jgi:hypothetical protein